MKKLIYCAVMLCMLMMVNFMYAEAVSLPADLTRIEEEAFFNCDYIRGKVYLPASVEYVGPRAFDGTRVTALQISGEATEIAPDAFGELSYIRVIWGSQIQLPAELIAKAKYLIVEPGTQTNADAAQEQINGDYLVVDDYFYYEATYDESGKGTLRLLCAIDGTLLPETVTIPARVEGMTVTEIAENAFWGVEGVTTVLVPEDAVIAEGTEDNLPAGALQTYTPAPLKKPMLSSYSVDNTSCTLCIERTEGDGIYRTDIYRSLSLDGQFVFIAQLDGETDEYRETGLPEGAVVYYQIQTFAEIDGVESVSEMSDIIEVELESSYREKEYSLQYAVYLEGPVLQWYGKHGDGYLIYRADSIDGPFEVIGEYNFSTIETDYALTKYQIPVTAAETAGYYKVQQYGYTEDWWEIYAERSESLYVPSLEDCKIIIRPDQEQYETGSKVTFSIDLPAHVQLDSSFGYFEIETDYDGKQYSSYIYETSHRFPDYPDVYNFEDEFSIIVAVDGEYKFTKLPFDSLTYSSDDDNVLIYPFSAKTMRGSQHPYYLSNTSAGGNGGIIDAWYDGEKDSGYQLVTFSELSNVKDDRLSLYDEWGREVWHYTGTEIAGKTVAVPGSGVGVKMEGTAHHSEFGYAIVNMVSMPYFDLEGVSLSCEGSEKTTDEAIVWTAKIKNGCAPFDVLWSIYKDGALIDELTGSELSLTYYPTDAGVYSAIATIKDHRCNIQLSSLDCTVVKANSSGAEFTYTQSAEGITLTGYTGSKTTVDIPSHINAMPVVAIEDSAFAGSKVQAWILPDSISRIGERAFAGAELVEIILPDNDSLTLGAHCFNGAKNLRRITLTRGLQSIPDYCFADSGLEAIHIPSNIETLKERAFRNCESLTSLTFASTSVKVIEYACFGGCSALRHVKLPDSLESLAIEAFSRSPYSWASLSIWVGPNTTNFGTDGYSVTPFPGEICTIYAPEDSKAAKWVLYHDYEAGFVYGGGGCEEFFDGNHDYQIISDTLSMNDDLSVHKHSLIYECSRCKLQKEENQREGVIGCWRCEAKAAYGADADIPADKFEFLDRYRLGGKIYYRVQLLEAYKGVKKGAGALFMDETLKMVTDDETLKYLFRVYIYTGEGTLPWEYTGTSDDYPSLERRKEHVNSAVNTAAEQLRLAEDFIKMDEGYKLVGEVAHGALQGIWGNPAGAVKTIAKASVPDMDALLVTTQVYILKHLADSMEQAAVAYESTLSDITDAQGFVICEEAEESLVAFADVMGMWRLCVDNGSPIIEEIANCGSAFGVGVRNIITMLKGASEGSFIGKLGTFVTDTMFKAFTSADSDNDPDAMYGVEMIGSMCELLSEAADNKLVSAWVNLYKADQFALTEVLYMDSAFETYEKWYNAFCLKGTELQETHLTLAGE